MLQGTQGKGEWHSWNEWGWAVSVFFPSHVVENMCDVGDLSFRRLARCGHQKSRFHLYCPVRLWASVFLTCEEKRLGREISTVPRTLTFYIFCSHPHKYCMPSHLCCSPSLGQQDDSALQRCVCGRAGSDLAFGAGSERADLKGHLYFFHYSVGWAKGKGSVAKGGDFSLRKLGLAEQGIGCYYQTLMAPDKG